eukprot:CAMPEP_0206196176 /NCGR_PEP_ID=MMETSP0166-20121206/8287_1 /ASSEMBLY_ACC=CAM_ASM_000260 /TAXON_ID=95228 /ORGANISM="Vannella robusta, Strain DIVA3 518/3/11/1/6" /LENGTH=260 /DNA_ID=CAMNT_0053613591 /DNA_START=169 /DNA_END=947 /DNA_ORIENTATION=+
MRQEIEREVKQQHSIRSLDPTWFSEKVQSLLKKALDMENATMEEKRLEMTYERSIREFEYLLRDSEVQQDKELKQKLEEQFYLIQRDMAWKKNKKLKQTKWIQNNMLVPARMFIWSSRIFFHRNQPVSQIDGQYRRVTTEKFSVSSACWFWRWRIVAVRTYAWFKNTASYCRYAICESPSSYKALFYRQPFSPRTSIDSKTGAEVRSRNVYSTLCSRIMALWNSVRQSRAEFEAQPDTGFLGKGVSRVFNIFWNYAIKMG